MVLRGSEALDRLPPSVNVPWFPLQDGGVVVRIGLRGEQYNVFKR